MELTVMRSRVAGGYGTCIVCHVHNSATYAVYSPSLGEYRAYCAVHVAFGIDWLASEVAPVNA